MLLAVYRQKARSVALWVSEYDGEGGAAVFHSELERPNVVAEIVVGVVASQTGNRRTDNLLVILLHLLIHNQNPFRVVWVSGLGNVAIRYIVVKGSFAASIYRDGVI